jgi:gluconate:H+ symporter, GntP family
MNFTKNDYISFHISLHFLQPFLSNMLTPIYVTTLLAAAIIAIILLSAKYKYNTFFVLLVVAITVGFAAGFDGEKVISLMKKGFGATLEKIGLLIILGTTLGTLLNKSNATLSLANFILKKTGEKNTPLAVTLMGFLIGLPIFCDSGFIVLIGLVLSLVQRTKGMHVQLVVCLATALYAVHCLVPPHPGISAAAATMKVDLGKAMLLGTILSIPPAIAAFFWAKFMGNKYGDFNMQLVDNQAITTENLPSPICSILPVIIPIFLIAIKSLVLLNTEIFTPSVLSIIKFLGEPIAALCVGIVLSFFCFKKINKADMNTMLEQSIEKSGHILAIIAIGGAFGEIIKGMDLGKVFGESLSGSGLGLLIPFALAVIFKTAQGSSTVAIISTASIIEPLLPALGFNTEGARLLALMSMGAGSMSISHANDAYFWVISKFGEMDTRTTLRAYSSASFLMGVVAFLSVWVASFFIK